MKKEEQFNNNKLTKLLQKVLNILHIKISPKTEKLLIQIFKFGIVGVIATLIDFIFLYIFKEVCHLNTILSNTLSFSI